MNSYVSYPIIKIPIQFEIVKKALPPLPEKPIEPKPPERKSPFKQPIAPVQSPDPYDAYFVGFIGIGLGYLIIFFGLEDASQDNKLIVICLSVLLFVVGIVYLCVGSHRASKVDTYKKIVKEYLNELELFNNKKKALEEQYHQELYDYQNVVYPDYICQLKKYDEQKQINYSKDYILDYRKKLLYAALRSTAKPSEVQIEYTRGAAESYFLKGVIQNFAVDQVRQGEYR